MADELAMPEPNANGLVEAAPGQGKPGLMATQKGKAIAIGVAVAVLLIIAGVVAALVILSRSSVKTETPIVEERQPVTSVTTGTAGVDTSTVVPVTTSEPVEPPRPAAYEGVFMSRDPMEPLAKPAPAPIDGADGTTTDTVEPGAVTGESTIMLAGISDHDGDGELEGHFVWNGNEYYAGDGERVGTSAFQVVRVYSTYVDMLYGDVRFNLPLYASRTK